MEKISCLAEIEIQGERVLRLVNCTQDRAVYEVIGFHIPTITIIDYRQRGLAAIRDVLRTGNMTQYASEFNTPAWLELQDDPEGNLLIELSEPNANVPTQMLWIAIGFQDAIPAYDCLFETFIPLVDQDALALAMLFNIPAVGINTYNYLSVDLPLWS